MQQISPKYLMNLTDQIEQKIWKEFESYKKVRRYITKWHESDFNYENFSIQNKPESNDIDLAETLHGIEPETLIKIAIDLGIETPDFIPSIPLFKNTLKTTYKRALDSFNESIKNVIEQPNLSVGLANTTLESIIKYILEDPKISVSWKETDTLYKLTQNILKEFVIFPSEQIPEQIRDIGSSLLNISKKIEELRSDKTLMHGKTDNGYMIEDRLYASFVINSVTTVGMFIISFYESKYKMNKENDLEDKIKPEDIPF